MTNTTPQPSEFYKSLDISALNPPMNVTLVDTNEKLSLITDFFSRKKTFGFDVETNVVKDINDRYVRTIQVGDREEQYVINLLAFAQAYAEMTGNSSPEAAMWVLKHAQRESKLREDVFGPIIAALRPALESRDWLKLGHFLQFEYENSRMGFGLRPWHFWDTMIAEQVLLCGLVAAKTVGYFALDDLMRKYGKVNIDKSLQTSFDDLGKPLTPEQIIYAALDVRLVFSIRDKQMRLLELDGLTPTAQVEFDAIPAFGDMRVHGFFCHKESWMDVFRDKLKELTSVIKQLDELFIPVVGRFVMPTYDLNSMETRWRLETDKELRAKYRRAYLVARGEISEAKKVQEEYQGEAAINYDSNQQLRAALLKMGIKARSLPDTNDKTLEKLQKHPAVKLVRQLRGLSKAVGTYGEEFIKKYISTISGRIHSSINQIGAGTGRTSSDNPNIQNIPSDEAYRACFKAREGYKIITVDISGCELRIAADMSNERVWLEAFEKDWDVHAMGAEDAYPEIWKQKAEPDCAYYRNKHKCKCKAHNEVRTPIKSRNFGVIYGLGEVGYANNTGKTRPEAHKDLVRFQKWVPTLWKFLEGLSTYATMNLESRTTLGRRRLFKRPTFDRARKHWIQKYRKKYGRDPIDAEVRREMAGMWASIGRAARNAPVQGGNGDLIKLAIGCGFDSNGKPFLWHTLEPKYEGKLENLVHDELVTESPEQNAEAISELIQDCITRAGAEIYKSVIMKSDAHIDDHWSKE
jgi:DNA polymerase-1